MQTHISEVSTVTIRWEVWKELVELAGRQIDPATADVICDVADMFDPYGLFPGNENAYPDRLYFARSPATNFWIEFRDLPEATRVALEHRDFTPTG
jgi:hypothetical protein